VKRSCADPRLILLLALLCALLAPRMGRGAGTPAPAPDPVAEKQRQLQALKTEIEANRKEIDRLKSKEHDLGKVKEHIRRDHELTLRYLKELEEQDATLRSDLADRQVDLLDHQSAAHDAAQRLKKEVVH
jgi:septal ring factor EnvC (AmiA/AmiB activator)